MIELDLDVEDLVGMRFAVSPLMETVMSLRTPLLPTYFVLQMPWWRRVHGDLAGLDMRPLTALVGVRRWVPDFLTPRPEVPAGARTAHPAGEGRRRHQGRPRGAPGAGRPPPR
jgi:hypothetical protein